MVDLLGRCLRAAGRLQEAESLLTTGGRRPGAAPRRRPPGRRRVALEPRGRGPEARRLRLLPGRLRRRVGRARLRRGAVPAGAGRRFDRDARTPPEVTLTALRNLGDCLVENGKPSQAAPVLGRVVQLRERLGLPLLGCVEDHAAMLHDAGEHAAARARRTGGPWRAQKAFGSESVDALPARENLAALLWDAGKAGGRSPSIGLYWSGWRRSSAARTPTPRRRATTSARCSSSSGARDEARPLLARALEGRRAYTRRRPPRRRRSRSAARGRPRAARAGPGAPPAVDAPLDGRGEPAVEAAAGVFCRRAEAPRPGNLCDIVF